MLRATPKISGILRKVGDENKMRDLSQIAVVLGMIGLGAAGYSVKTLFDKRGDESSIEILAHDCSNTNTGPLIPIAELLGMSPEQSRRMCTTPEQVNAWNERNNPEGQG